MSGPSFHLRLPPLSLFKFPPDPEPYALPPPSDEATFKSPFPIDAKLYNDLLDWRVPATIATVYAITVTIWNKLNRDRGHKPWALSKTRAFRAFVIIHNVALALFSALTFVAMMRALRHSWPGRYERDGFGLWWPTWRTENGFAGAADALCKLNGPRGLGDAAYFNSTSRLWEIKNQLIHLAENGKPDPTDVGRMWNEGVAFWGWFFYLSKFYEVLDTAIILLKGKRSSFLQTYHHAGAMFCMWAGIRYMSPPIWMFCWLNSGIHAMMYTYYTLSALGVRVPQRLKRTLTTLQITQFFMGITFAAAHLFITYSVPVTTTYKFTTTVKSALSAVTSAASEVLSEETAAITAAGVGNFLKKLAFRAAGEEGLAENVRDSHGHIFSQSQGPILSREAQRVVDTIREETRTRHEFHEIPCIDTSGQSFAIWLNLVYLLPLTGLFIRFFRRSYTRRTSSSAKHPTHQNTIAKSAKDALHGVDRELEHVGSAVIDEISSVGAKIKETAGKVDTKRISQTIEKLEHQMKDGADTAIQKAKELSEKTKKELEELRKNGSPVVDRAKERANELKNKGIQGAEAVSRKANEVLAQSKEKAKPYVDEATEKANEYAQLAKEKAEEVKKATEGKAKAAGNAAKEQGQTAKEKAEDVSEDAKQRAEDVTDEVKDRAGDAKDQAQQKAGQVKEETQDKAKQAKDKANNAKDQAKDKANEAKDQTKDKSAEMKKETEDKAESTKDETKAKSQPNSKSNSKSGSKSRSRSRNGKNSPQEAPQTPKRQSQDKSTSNEATPSGSQTSPSISGSYDNIGRQEAEGSPEQDYGQSTAAHSQPHIEHDASRHAPEGLSTTDPHEAHVSYSDMIKEAGKK